MSSARFPKLANVMRHDVTNEMNQKIDQRIARRLKKFIRRCVRKVRRVEEPGGIKFVTNWKSFSIQNISV
jgi:hypothetical protein